MKKISLILVMAILLSNALVLSVFSAFVPIDDPAPYVYDFTNPKWTDQTAVVRNSIPYVLGYNNENNGTLYFSNISETPGKVSFVADATGYSTGITPRLRLGQGDSSKPYKTGLVRVETSVRIENPAQAQTKAHLYMAVKGRDAENSVYMLAQTGSSANNGFFVYTPSGSDNIQFLEDNSDFMYGKWIHYTFEIGRAHV